MADNRGYIELWKNPLKEVEGEAILKTPATAEFWGNRFGQVFEAGGFVVGGFKYGFAAYSGTTLAGEGSVPARNKAQHWATAYGGTYDVNTTTGVITTRYVAAGFNTGEVDVQAVGSGQNVLKFQLQVSRNTPVVALAFPNIRTFAEADARGLTFGSFNPATGTMTATSVALAPASTTLVAMTSSSTAGAKVPIYVAVFSDGTIIEFNQMDPTNTEKQKKIENSTK